ncbi:hypothetical protein D3C81_2138170 [compost metagenome]
MLRGKVRRHKTRKNMEAVSQRQPHLSVKATNFTYIIGNLKVLYKDVVKLVNRSTGYAEQAVT